jgi:hypothetical protein
MRFVARARAGRLTGEGFEKLVGRICRQSHQAAREEHNNIYAAPKGGSRVSLDRAGIAMT